MRFASPVANLNTGGDDMVVAFLLMCCIDSPPFVPVSQANTIEVGDKGLTADVLNRLQKGVVYIITEDGVPNGTVEISPSDADKAAFMGSDILQEPDRAEEDTVYDMPEPKEPQ
jgi:hypothetical protein